MAGITLTEAADQVQAAFDTLQLPTPQKIFLGKNFSRVAVGGRIPYAELMEMLQACIHKAQDKREKGYKDLAEKIIKQLDKIARVHKLAPLENIEIITKVAMEALKPAEIFPDAGKAKLKCNPILDRCVFAKILSLLIYAKESLLMMQYEHEAMTEKVKADQKLHTVVLDDTPLINFSIKESNRHFLTLPYNLSGAGLAFYFRWFRRFEEDDSGLAVPSLELRASDLPEIRTFQQDSDPDIRIAAQRLLTFIESKQNIIAQNKKIQPFDEAFKNIRTKTDVQSEANNFFIDKHYPLFKEMQDLAEFLLQNSLSPDKINVLKEKIIAQIPGSANFFNFVYRYFYKEYARLFKPDEEHAPSKYPSIFNREYTFPAPDELGTFFTIKEPKKVQAVEKKEAAPAPEKSKKKPPSKEIQEKVQPKPSAAAPKSRDDVADILAKKVFPVKEIVYSDRVLAAIQDQAAFSVDGDGRHRFFLQMDQFLGTIYSQKRKWINTSGHRDTLYVMPGEIEVSKDEWKRCQFEWCIGADGKCYHRFCSFKEKNILIESWMSGTALTDENFPTLQQSYKDATWKEKPQEKRVDNITITVDPVLNFITFTDARTNISCRIFKIGK